MSGYRTRSVQYRRPGPGSGPTRHRHRLVPPADPGAGLLESAVLPLVPDGELNTCHNALDRHIEAGAGARTALIYDSPVTGSRRRYSYAELRDEVARFAGVLAGLGVAKGDRVVIYLPMVPEAAVAMLACARIGAVHSVVFGASRPRSWRCGSTTRRRR